MNPCILAASPLALVGPLVIVAVFIGVIKVVELCNRKTPRIREDAFCSHTEKREPMSGENVGNDDALVKMDKILERHLSAIGYLQGKGTPFWRMFWAVFLAVTLAGVLFKAVGLSIDVNTEIGKKGVFVMPYGDKMYKIVAPDSEEERWPLYR